jgi:hypothetical protein
MSGLKERLALIRKAHQAGPTPVVAPEAVQDVPSSSSTQAPPVTDVAGGQDPFQGSSPAAVSPPAPPSPPPEEASLDLDECFGAPAASAEPRVLGKRTLGEVENEGVAFPKGPGRKRPRLVIRIPDDRSDGEPEDSAAAASSAEAPEAAPVVNWAWRRARLQRLAPSLALPDEPPAQRRRRPRPSTGAPHPESEAGPTTSLPSVPTSTALVVAVPVEMQDQLSRPNLCQLVPFREQLLGPKLSEARSTALRDGARLCRESAKVTKSVLQPVQKLRTDEALALHLKTPVWRLNPTRAMLANTLCHADRMRRSQWEQLLFQFAEEGLIDWVHLMELVRYDESRFLVTQKKIATDLKKAEGVGAAAPAVGALEDPRPQEREEQQLALPQTFELEIVRASGKGATARTSKIRGTAKFFQTKTDYASVIFVKVPGVREDLRYVFLQGVCVNWLQVIQRTTAECERTALLDTMSSTEKSRKAKMKTRAVQADRASSGVRCENQLEKELLGWVNLTFGCEVHMMGTSHGSIFVGLLDSTTRGMKHMALVVNSVDAAEVFQEVIKDWVKRNTVIIRGEPPRAVALRRALLMRLLFGRGPMHMERRHALMAANGNWDRRDKIEVYIPYLTA